MTNEKIINTFFSVVNDVKKTAFSIDIIGLDFHLGGDLGIDSRDMLEIWYDLENAVGVSVPDSEKRDLFTVQDVVSVLERKLSLETA